MKTSDDTTMDDGGDRRPPVADNQTYTQFFFDVMCLQCTQEIGITLGMNPDTKIFCSTDCLNEYKKELHLGGDN